MTDALRAWLYGIAVASFCAALLELLPPKPEMKKTMRIVTGLFLLSVIAAPLQSLRRDTNLQAIFNAASPSSEGTASAESALYALLNQSLQPALAAAAQRAKISILRSEIDAVSEADGCINIQSVTVYTSCTEADRCAAFAALLQAELGCPADVQWEETE